MKFFILFFLIATFPIIAGQAHIPETHAITSADKKIVFIMTSPTLSDNSKTVKHGTGTAYKIQKDGTLKKIWKVSGWYSNRIHIDKTGSYLIRRGNRKIWSKFLDHDSAAAFYKDGRLLKEYKIKDLHKETETEKISANSWETINSHFPKLDGEKYYIKTAAGKIIIFDITTGKILKEEK